MITKQDILDRAAEWQMQPQVVEKDYVLGWLLAATTVHPVAKEYWVFKGGTSIKKCYFETYRFSEDLDFSLLPDAPYSEAEIKNTINELTQKATEMSGIVFAQDSTIVSARHDKLNRPTFQGKIYYQGPLGQVRSLPKIIFDITNNEPILGIPARRPILHAYPDALAAESGVLTYALDELLAEKTRALYERTRPRDLYDVIYLLENQRHALNLDNVRMLFRKKCEAKNIAIPTTDSLNTQVHEDQELVADWEHMLAHQLPVLPKLEDFIARLAQAIAWITEAPTMPSNAGLQSYAGAQGEVIENPTGMHFWGQGLPLEAIRFAGTNRLMVQFLYNGEQRLVEPYSLRRANTGNLLLYGWEMRSGQIKAFNVVKMTQLQATTNTFIPKFRIELTGQGQLNVANSSRPLAYPTYNNLTPKRKSTGGPSYTYECTRCMKKFQHSKRESKLRKHKDQYGSKCYGTYGRYIS